MKTRARNATCLERLCAARRRPAVRGTAAYSRHLVGEGNRSRNKRGNGPVLATTRRRLGLRNQDRPSPYFLSKNRNIFLYASSNSLALGL